MPSREAKLAMRAPRGVAAATATAGDSRIIRKHMHASRRSGPPSPSTQEKLSGSLNALMAAPASATSLQLSLENEKLQKARAAYTAALQSAGEGKEDIVGYVFAINGRIVSADVYPSNGLFAKMWSKQLGAGVTEAIGEAGGTHAAAAGAGRGSGVPQGRRGHLRPRRSR